MAVARAVPPARNATLSPRKSSSPSGIVSRVADSLVLVESSGASNDFGSQRESSQRRMVAPSAPPVHVIASSPNHTAPRASSKLASVDRHCTVDHEDHAYARGHRRNRGVLVDVFEKAETRHHLRSGAAAAALVRLRFRCAPGGGMPPLKRGIADEICSC